MGINDLRDKGGALAAIVVVSLGALLVGCATASTPLSTPLPGLTVTPVGDAETKSAADAGATRIPVASAQPTDAPGPGVSEPVVARSDKTRNDMPEVEWSALSALTESNNDFAFDFYRQLIEIEEGNLFFSPYSLSSALAMTYAGAAGATAEQMADALHFDLPYAEFHTTFNALDLQLAQIGGDGSAGGEGFPKLNVANALWAQRGYQFLPPFLDTLAQHYGAALEQLDFTQPEERKAAAGRINQWASEQTAGRIPAVVAPDKFGPCLPPDWECTRLVITNAIYFKGLWMEKRDFDETATKDEDFHLGDGGSVLAPMMRQSREFDYRETDDYQAVELPYQGDRLVMLVLLPKKDREEEFAAGLGASLVADFGSAANERVVRLSMPRFKLEKSVDAKDLLQEMGMTDAFSPAEGVADFSGMADFDHPDSPDVGIYIQDVFQKAFVEVNEKGTEAAAVTTVIGTAMPASVPPTPLPPVAMKVNRPFVFVILDTYTRSILFVGRVADPTLEE